MDETAAFRYRHDTMRLLLLLSALLGALSGVASPRVAAQPVQASAAAAIVVSGLTAVAPASRRFAVASYRSRPSLRLPALATFAIVASQPLYAERRRE